MRKTKKQLLGLVCLAAVALMTAFAISLPAPDAAAADDDAVTSGDNNTQVQVTVFEDQKASVRIQSPRNGEEFTTNVIPVSILYTRAHRIELSYKDGKGVERKKAFDIAADQFESGVVTTQLVLDDYIKEPTTLKVTLYGNNGTMMEDFVQFSYRAISTDMGETNKDNGDPSVDIKVDDTVDTIGVQVYDKDGKPLFTDKDGNDTPLIIDRDKIDPDTGEVEITLPDGTTITGHYNEETGEINLELPFDKYGASEGEYTTVIIGYDKDGDIVSVNQEKFDYKPVTPELPNTGSIFGNLNISRADYLVTGLIAFGLAAGFAMVLIFRRNHRS